MNSFKSKLLKRTTQTSAFLIALLFTHSIFAAQGYATRYWDACKPHCSWAENVDGNPVKSCNLTNQVNPITGVEIESGCEGGDAYTCWDMSPKRISDTLSYGYAAVPATGDICGVCYELTFTGTGKYSDTEPGSRVLKNKGKKMIVMATNIGHDVAGGQFDILIPGGGVGLYSACEDQWGVPTADLGAQYGGFLTACQADLGYNDTNALKSCVQNSCDTVFSKPGMEDLKSGCDWYVDWFEMADNPNLEYQVVSCPAELISGAYDIDVDINTAPSINSAALVNGVLTANATDAESTSNELSYSWFINSIEVATGSNVSAPENITGIKFVTLIVSDGELSTQEIFSADFGELEVNNTAPTITSAVFSNGNLTATASDSQTPSADLNYTWSINGVTIGTGASIIAPTSYTGNVNVRITVSDGELSSVTNFIVDFGTTEPEPDPNTAPVIHSATYSNGYLVADISDDQSVVISWSINNIIIGTSPNMPVPSSITGTQSVTLNVSDGELTTQQTFVIDFGAPNTDTDTQTNTAPVITSANLSNGYLQANASDDQSVANELIYSWFINDLLIATGQTALAPTSITGSQLVTLTVSDGQLSTEFTFRAEFPTNSPGLNTSPTIHSASFVNGFLTTNTSDAQSSANALTYNWFIDNSLIATGSTVQAPTNITGTKLVTLIVSDGELSSQTTFSAYFGEATSTPAAPSDSTTGAFIWYELFALFAFGMFYITRRKYS